MNKNIKFLFLFSPALLTLYFFPSFWCGIGAKKWMTDKQSSQVMLSTGVEQWLDRSLNTCDFKTHSDLFNGEWLFATYMMSGMGFGQMAFRYPEKKIHYLKQMERCIEQLLSKKVRAFDQAAWGNDPLKALHFSSFSPCTNKFPQDSFYTTADHAAYFGYLNLLLSFHRYLDNKSKYAVLNDSISQFLTEHLEASPLLLLHTYPGEMYVIDNCAVIGSLGLYGKATHNIRYCNLAKSWIQRCSKDYTDPKTGLLYQSINENGKSYDSPRGSGTTLGIYFLSFTDINFSQQLYSSVKKELMVSFANFCAVREYPHGSKERGDIDSGPVVLGMGFSATGFSLAGAKIFKDSNVFRKLYSLTYLFGTPTTRNNALQYSTGGPLGTSIMFAVLTALPEEMVKKL